MNRIVN